MARAQTRKKASIEIKKFYGINESDAGQTVLKKGESPYMRNFRVDGNGKLVKRKGWNRLADIDGQIRSMWHGYIGENECLLIVISSTLYRVNLSDWTLQSIASVSSNCLTMFHYGSYVYIYGDAECLRYNGQTVSAETGYVPIAYINSLPSGSGDAYEMPNLICFSKSQRFTGDGSTKVFYVYEKKISNLLGVTLNGSTISGYSYEAGTGKVTFSTAPASGAVLEIKWKNENTTTTNTKFKTLAAKYSRVIGSRVFLWGYSDSPNLIRFSALDKNGDPHANFFTENSSVTVGTSASPVTDVVQHYDRIIVFTKTEAWLLSLDNSGPTTIAKATVVNSCKGQQAYAATQLIDNSPFTVMSDGVYKWTSTGVKDERNAVLVSQRTAETLKSHDCASAVTYDDERDGEYWLCFPDGICVIYNYRNDVWYVYDNIFVKRLFWLGGKMRFINAENSICEFSENLFTDDGEAVGCEWQMNFEGFGDNASGKNLLRAFVSLEPENRAEYHLDWQTDRDCSKMYQSAGSVGGAYSFFAYDSVCYDDFSYDTLYTPKVFRHRLPLKHFSYVKLSLSNNQPHSGCTVVGLSLEGYKSGEVKN